MPDPFAWLAERAAAVVETLGYGGVALLIALESLFPPIPSELILPMAGFLSGQGRFWLPGAILAATAGSVVGGLVIYTTAAKLGEARVRRLVERYGRFLTVSTADLDRAEGWFDRHGAAAVLIGHVVPVVRSLVSVPAGFGRMTVSRFVLSTILGAGAWNSVLIGLGWALGERWTEVKQYAQYAQYVLLVIAIAAGTWIWRRRRGSSATEEANPSL